MLQKIAIKAIQYYQRKWASRFGGHCVFEPSCAIYAIVAFKKYGFWGGMLKTGKRLRQCRQPYGGYDPI